MLNMLIKKFGQRNLCKKIWILSIIYPIFYFLIKSLVRNDLNLLLSIPVYLIIAMLTISHFILYKLAEKNKEKRLLISKISFYLIIANIIGLLLSILMPTTFLLILFIQIIAIIVFYLKNKS